ncbi:MAG: lon, partial [Clostridia bacterium]|nr:lon [Clostridia bacterium]
MDNLDRFLTNTNNIKTIVDIYGSEVITLPVLPLRNLVAFPHMSLYLDVGRKKSIAAVNAAMKQNNYIYLVTQIDLLENEPESSNLYQVGIVAKVKQMLKLPGDEIRVALEGVCRATSLGEMTDNGDFGEISIKCVNEMPCHDNGDNKTNALIRKLQSCFGEFSVYIEKISPEVVMKVTSEQDGGVLADYITQNLFLKYQDKQDILACFEPQRRIEELIVILTRETEILDIERQINGKVREKISKNQREYYIREQIKILQDEIGEGENLSAEADEYFEKIEKLDVSGEIKKKLAKEAYRLLKMPFGSHESSVIRTYLDACLELPWNKYTNDAIDIEKAQKILDKDHYGLTKIKERILEVLAVKKLAVDHKGQILCLIGPPGTGKTSIAQSIAKATHRKFARISLGGVHDESEIRGHRRTYIGAMPGKIINAIKEANSSNPIILLDEVDKLGNDYKGDPSSALLEVLDPEQNKNFKDHFIDIPFDLSNVLFIATANMADTIPLPLLDRMDVIELTSYTEEEKFHIAKKHLMPKQLKKHGLSGRSCKIEDAAIEGMIKNYTREAGVRELERTIA